MSALLPALRAALAAALGSPDRGAETVAADADLLAQARDLGVLPVLAAHASGLDAATEATLLAARARTAAHAARARVELGEVLAALERARVPALSIKGLALAAQTGVARLACDLDVLLARPADLGRATRALAALGLRADRDAPPPCDLLGERVLFAPDRLPVDLHLSPVKSLLRPRAPRPGPTDVRRLALGPGLVVTTLDPAWTLALAAVHLHQDGGTSLRRLVDLAALLARLEPEALAGGHAVARRLGVSGVLRFGAGRARAWLGVERAVPWGPRPATALQAWLLPRLAQPGRWTARDGPPGEAVRMRHLVLRLALEDDAPRVLADRLLRLAFPPAAYARWRGDGPGRPLSLAWRALRAMGIGG